MTTLFKNAARMGMVAMAASGFSIAQDGAKGTPGAAPADSFAAADEGATKTDFSYAIGYQSGTNFMNDLVPYGATLGDLDMDTFIKGFTAAADGEKPEIEVERLQKSMAALAEYLENREATIGEENLKAGKEFLEENGKREGVLTTASGLQYEVLAKGGESKYVQPKEGSPEKLFMMNFKGTLVDGTEFLVSPEAGPVPMIREKMVEGFREAATSMPVGAKWKVYIPSELAYKQERRSKEIGPNSTLIYEMELVEFKDAPVAPEGGGFPLPIPSQ